MRDVAVVGGGCYGTFYAGQLVRAKERGKARFRRVVVVDRDPACRARVELGEAPDRVFVAREWDDYFRELLGGATPAAAGEPRDYIVPSPLMPHLMFQWLLARARERWPVHGSALFVCRHHVFGVGTFAVDAVLEGDALVRAAGATGSAAAVLVGTISSCHGALNLLRIGAA